jgi:hypothetical protein
VEIALDRTASKASTMATNTHPDFVPASLAFMLSSSANALISRTIGPTSPRRETSEASWSADWRGTAALR